MDELVIRDLQGRTGDDEKDELRRWREASGEHEARYQELRALWALTGMRDEIDTLKALPSAGDFLRPAADRPTADRPDQTARSVSAALEASGSRRTQGDAPHSRTRPSTEKRLRRRKRGYAFLAAAAAVVLALGIGHLVTSGTDPAAQEVALFESGPNELLTAMLDDGSVARLAPGSRLEVRMGPEGRDVRLEGRAFFAVAHHEDRPFRVRSGAGEVEVLGTRFEVDTQRNGFRLLVVEGRVAFTLGASALEVQAGELAEATGDASPLVTRVERPEALLDWMGVWMAFENTPLHRVVRELEVRLGIEIELADAAVADRTVSGWFGQMERDEMISMICRVADLRCEVEPGRVRIEG